VIALVLLSIGAAQAVAFGIIMSAPPVEAPTISVGEVKQALLGGAEPSDRNLRLQREIMDDDPFGGHVMSPAEGLISRLIASALGVAVDQVKVVLPKSGAAGAGSVLSEGSSVFILQNRPSAALPPPGGRSVPVLRAADGIEFPAFAAAIRTGGGQWVVVRPVEPFLSPLQVRILAGFLASVLIMGPLAWLVANRITRPIRLFADAAKRLGADPGAPPLQPSGSIEVRTAVVAFNEMQESLRSYVHGRTQMLVAIAHDLRTPLTRLRFRAEAGPPAYRDKMAADIEQMDDMIRQVLALSRTQSGDGSRQWVDLGALVTSAGRAFAETGACVTVSARAGIALFGDPLNLRRMIDNLIENAVKFGGHARVSLSTEGGSAVMTIDDDGPGLPEDQLTNVFEPFHRLEPSRSRATGGVGLGLTIVRSVVAAHGGNIVLINLPGGGLQARVSVPLTAESKA
jgi:signal transduction histidine kinase